MTIAFIGAGNMAGSLIRGLQAGGLGSFAVPKSPADIRSLFQARFVVGRKSNLVRENPNKI